MATKKVHAKNLDQFVVEAESEGFNYVMDNPKRGVVKELAGTTPTGMLLNALAGCIVITARSYFDRNEIKVTELTTDIEGDFQYADGAWKLTVEAVINTDATLDAESLKKLISFIDRFCTVSGVLAAGNTINLTVNHQ